MGKQCVMKSCKRERFLITLLFVSARPQRIKKEKSEALSGGKQSFPECPVSSDKPTQQSAPSGNPVAPPTEACFPGCSGKLAEALLASLTNTQSLRSHQAMASSSHLCALRSPFVQETSPSHPLPSGAAW